jgi:hypothetical protein
MVSPSFATGETVNLRIAGSHPIGHHSTDLSSVLLFNPEGFVFSDEVSLGNANGSSRIGDSTADSLCLAAVSF